MIALMVRLALQLSEGPDLSSLVERLTDGDPAIREAATLDLVALGPGIVPALEPFRDDDDPEVAARVAWILSQLAPRSLAEMLTVGARWVAEGLERRAVPGGGFEYTDTKWTEDRRLPHVVTVVADTQGRILQISGTCMTIYDRPD